MYIHMHRVQSRANIIPQRNASKSDRDPCLYLPHYDGVSHDLGHHHRLLDASDLYADSGYHRLYDESSRRHRRDDAVRLFCRDAFSHLGCLAAFFLHHDAFDPLRPLDVSSRHRDLS